MPSTCKPRPLVEMSGAPVEPIVISPPWQSARSHEVDGEWSGGGRPWHAPHAACAPDVSFHAGRAGGPARFAPWQAVFVHCEPVHAGWAPRAVASPEKVTCTVPSR